MVLVIAHFDIDTFLSVMQAWLRCKGFDLISFQNTMCIHYEPIKFNKLIQIESIEYEPDMDLTRSAWILSN